MKKRILRCICIIIGSAIALNGICMLLFANATIGSWLTLLLGLIFLVPSLFIRLTLKMMTRRLFKMIAVILFFSGALMLLTTIFLYLYGNNNTATYNEDYLLVLGCGVRGEQPTEPLKARLDAALSYLERNEDCLIIVSGGQGNGEDITEAEAMRRYLTANGIDNSRIIPEGKSTSTTENFSFSDRTVDGRLTTSSVAFVTNDFHIYRASSLAGLQGYSFNHISAPTKWYNVIPSYLREFLAIGQMFVFHK